MKKKCIPDPSLTAPFLGIYRYENVLLTATHNHSAVGGYLQYFAYLASSLGFVDDSFQAIKKGIVEVSALTKNAPSNLSRYRTASLPRWTYYRYPFDH
jgi:hypothetical protein